MSAFLIGLVIGLWVGLSVGIVIGLSKVSEAEPFDPTAERWVRTFYPTIEEQKKQVIEEFRGMPWEKDADAWRNA